MPKPRMEDEQFLRCAEFFFIYLPSLLFVTMFNKKELIVFSLSHTLTHNVNSIRARAKVNKKSVLRRFAISATIHYCICRCSMPSRARGGDSVSTALWYGNQPTIITLLLLYYYSILFYIITLQ